MGGFSLFGNALEEEVKSATTAEQPDTISKTSSLTMASGGSQAKGNPLRNVKKNNTTTPMVAPKTDLGTYTQGNTREKLNDRQLLGY